MATDEEYNAIVDEVIKDMFPKDQPIYILLEHPDMTYYGDAVIHGVFATRDEAEAYAKSHDLPTGQWDRYGIESWHIGETERDSHA